MPLSKLGEERLGEHALKLDGIEGSGVLPGSFEGMDGPVEGGQFSLQFRWH